MRLEKMEKSEILDLEEEQELSVLKPMLEEEIMEIEMILGYKFGEKMLLAEAFTHRSCNYPLKKDQNSYERLEFVGDAVLGCLMAWEVFSCYGDLSSGQLALLRAANVDTERLARIAVDSDLYRFVRHNAPQLEWKISGFRCDFMFLKFLHGFKVLESVQVSGF